MPVRKEWFALGIILLLLGVYALFTGIVVADGYGIADRLTIAVFLGGFLSLALGLTMMIIWAVGK